MVTFVDLTFDPQTLADIDPTHKVIVTVRTNTGGAIFDSTGDKVFLGTYSQTLQGTDTFTASLPVTNEATNPTAFQYAVSVYYMQTTPDGKSERKTWDSGWFSLTATSTLNAIVEEQYVPPTWMTTATATLQTYVDDAAASEAAAATSASEAAASAALADSYIVADLNTSDGQMEALIESPTSLTSAALSATYVSAVVATGTGIDPTGVADSTTALQAKIDLAASSGKGLFVPEGTYTVTAALSLPSNVDIRGAGRDVTAIVQAADNAPVMASAGYLGGASPAGRCNISHLTVRGTGVGASQHGIVVRDYYSTVEHVGFDTLGGNGLHMTHLDSAGANPVAGTLVENNVSNCVARSIGGTAYYLGAGGNGKITDGYFRDCISATVGAYHLFIGSSAGWQVSGLHTYGTTTGTAVWLERGFNTHARDFYIESFTTYAVHLAATQRNVSLAGIKANRTSATSEVVRVDRDAAFLGGVVQVSDVVVNNSHDSDATIVNGSSTGLRIRTSRLMGEGTYGYRVALTAGSGHEAPQTNRTIVDPMPLAFGLRAAWSGTGSKTLAFVIPGGTTFHVLPCQLRITGILNYNSTLQTRYVGELTLSFKASTDAPSVYLTERTDPAKAGFTVSPTAAVVRFNPRGAYADLTAYAVGDTVGYLGSTWVAQAAVSAANTTDPIDDQTTWKRLAPGNKGAASEGVVLTVTFEPSSASNFGSATVTGAA